MVTEMERSTVSDTSGIEQNLSVERLVYVR